MIKYNLIITGILFGILLNLLNNLRLLKRLKSGKRKSTGSPLVSVLIPARNESENIEKCVISILEQDYPNYEVIVLDDNSEDNTLIKLEKIKEEYPHLEIFSNDVLLDGWTGKNFSCHTLSRYAKGDWLLFTDADTVHEKDSISTSIDAIISEKAELLSIMPDLVMKTLPEKLFMPLVHFAFFSFIPLGLMNTIKEPRVVIALGPFMLINAKFYRKIGGHEKIKDKIVDDLQIAQEVKRNGGKVVFMDGQDEVSLRFYTNFKDLWNGFSKNSFGAFNNSPLILLVFLLFNFLIYILPVFTFLYGILKLELYLFPTLQVLLITIHRYFLSIRFRINLRLILLHPAALLFGFLIALNSMHLTLSNKAMVWKERIYRP
ncbi:glycosyltransferase [candidate division WOR-3 bacterium]|nr:glycosyltransferase [candidate division WOR-3 bacterium]